MFSCNADPLATDEDFDRDWGSFDGTSDQNAFNEIPNLIFGH
jgi:hypothetical protein